MDLRLTMLNVNDVVVLIDEDDDDIYIYDDNVSKNKNSYYEILQFRPRSIGIVV